MKEALRGGGEVEEEKEGWTKSGQKKLLMKKKKKKTNSENIEALYERLKRSGTSPGLCYFVICTELKKSIYLGSLYVHISTYVLVLL